ncbi:Peptidoglycan-binding domain 1 protein [Halothece sp. PCC 7418]|uniref:peptidoglycan-binding protein n=1 Tax=Halothece sp. (strain PCC 7418) TaxID=65093 RepID=UPI0002A0831C|nr:peptidoglycan-binding protein [Halothece sp. PCC 7418]AFZ45788.1 Peptidoglycan-binding domain 1 protein [Halothece sp. PCC 7418]
MINWKTLPRQRGIYQITTGSVSYVGLSDNIQLRVKQHLESSSCRSRIILDTNKAKIIVLELLPDSDDKTLALREWYWFYKLKKKGHIMVNDPKTLGKTKTGQFFPPQTQKATAANTSSSLPFGCGVKLAGVTTVVVGFFCLGFLVAGNLVQQGVSGTPDSEAKPEEASETNSESQVSGNREGLQETSNSQRTVNMQPLSACIRPLQRGSSKEAVRLLQEQLEQLGYYQGEKDGLYGPGTEGAVAEFQRDHDLGVDGIVGCDTQAAINQELR